MGSKPSNSHTDRIAHKSQTGRGHQSLGLRQYAGSVRCQITAQAEFLPREQDCRAVIANRTADENAIASVHTIHGKTRTVSAEANSGGGEVDPIAVTAADNLGIACNDRHATIARRLCERVDHAPKQRDLQALLQKYTQRHESRQRTADSKIVDRAMDGQGTDVSTREFKWLDCEPICRHDELAIAGDG
jgi:hypothetical protein